MNDILDCLIIGSGPAGISAGIYASRAGLKVAIIEYDAPGGKLVKTHKVENYPGIASTSGVDLALKMFDHVQNSDVEILSGKVTDIEKEANLFKVYISEKEILSKTVIVSSGTKERCLGLEFENEFVGRGISFCAVCDGSFYKDKDVIVVGGGNSALEESLYLAQFCHKVTIVIRRDQFRADKSIVDLVLNTNNIEIVYNSTPLELIIENQQIIGLRVVNKITQQVSGIKAGCIFPYIGADPETKFLSRFDVLDDSGFIIVDSNMATNVLGLFGAGDVVKKHLRQIVTATNDGAIAALSANAYLKGVHNV